MMKRIISLILVAVLSMCVCTCAFAQEDTAYQNIETNKSFDDVLFVQNGVTYLPLRLVLPTSIDETNIKKLDTVWDEIGKTDIRLSHGNYVLDENKRASFDGERTQIYLRKISENAETGAYQYRAYLKRYSERDLDGYAIDPIHYNWNLENPVYFRTVVNSDGSSGSRAFLSVADIEKITRELLGENANYNATLN